MTDPTARRAALNPAMWIVLGFGASFLGGPSMSFGQTRPTQAEDASPRSATERYRGTRIKAVTLVFEGGSIPEAASALIELSAGDVYRPEAVRRSIRQLFALGVFSDIKVEAERVGDEVNVLFRIYPSTAIADVAIQLPVQVTPATVRVEKLSSRLVEETGLRAGDPLEVSSLNDASERVRALLRDEGMLWAQVEPEASFQSPSAKVIFHIDPGQQARVSDVTVRGVAPHLVTHLRNVVSLKPHDLFSRNELDERIETVEEQWRDRGYYEAAIDVTVTQNDADGYVGLTLEPQLGPRVVIDVQGADFSDDAVRELVPLYRERRLTADLVEESRANLEDDLRERGHRDARVTVERERSSDEAYAYLRFRVEPGPRYDVAAIVFEGVRSVPEASLVGLLVTEPARRFRSPPYRERVWRGDLAEIRTYFERQGFHQVTVEGSERAAEQSPSQLTLVATVTEGPRAAIGAIRVDGNDAIPSDEVVRVSGLVPSAPFDASGIVQARERVLSFYRNLGFGRAVVGARTSLNEEGTLAEVSFDVREGIQTRVDRVILSGLMVSRESSVRQLVSIEAGEPLSPLDLLETRQQLVGSGLFRNVSIDVLPADPLTNRSDVLISVTEGPRTTFAYGFGFEERQLGRAEIELTRRNLFGRNRTVSVFTRASFRGGRFITTYRQPNSFVRNLPLFVSVFAEEEERTSFDFNRVGVGLQVSKRLSNEESLFFRYRFDRTKVFNLLVDIDEVDRRFRNTTISSLSVASLTDRRDDPLDPSEGQFRILDVEWSSKFLGSQAPYIKGLAQQFYYFPLPGRVVAAVGMRLGVGQTYREDRDALMPVAERFYAGGATTLRGFALDQASPKRLFTVDVDGERTVVEGEPLGGNVISLLNLELRFPVLGNLHGVVFSDSGNVYRRLQVIKLLNWRYNVGFGLRYDTPLGPLRLDYGFKLDRRTRHSVTCADVTLACTESAGQWHVSLGHAF